MKKMTAILLPVLIVLVPDVKGGMIELVGPTKYYTGRIHVQAECSVGPSSLNNGRFCGIMIPKWANTAYLNYLEGSGTCVSDDGSTGAIRLIADLSSVYLGCHIRRVNDASTRNKIHTNYYIHLKNDVDPGTLADVPVSLGVSATGVGVEVSASGSMTLPDGATIAGEWRGSTSWAHSPYYTLKPEAWTLNIEPSKRVRIHYADEIRLGKREERVVMRSSEPVFVTASTDLQHVSLYNESGIELLGDKRVVREQIRIRENGSSKGITRGSVSLNVEVM